ncbi:hypothetical protein NX059_005751 [Plenodomus lindquistii]|nr:hypothetical protein NX059_005751 [Plenodomus lindquistii]
MSANAPYYQMPPNQCSNATNSTNAVQSRFTPEEGEYHLPVSATVTSPHEPTHSPMYTEPIAHQMSMEHTYEGSQNLANLLEAVSSAATGQATQAEEMPGHAGPSIPSHDGGKRKRASNSAPHETAIIEEISGSKRRRIHVPTDPQLQAVDYSGHIDIDNTSAPPSNETLLNDARAAGVHSAAALFRRSSERSSRKYTRPPMSKLFMSLQLSPEDFLQLQAQAKAYMLDTTHPERQSCVGNRGKGDTDMVKLRLFNCVRDFLNDKAGEQFFGEHVAKPGEREAIEAARALGEDKVINPEGRLTWPRDGNKIISLVTPLMRRMVTNERQRQYAIETRKGGTKKGKEGSAEAVGHDCEQARLPFDPKMAQHLQHSQPTSPSSPTVAVHSPMHDGVAPQFVREMAANKTASRWVTHAQLPPACSVEPHLSHINIFLVSASRDGKAAVKLDERRISAQHPAHLTFYDWKDFQKEVHGLLLQAKARHPELRRRPLSHGTDVGGNSLRGLAAAANALQSEVSPADPTKSDGLVAQDHVQRPAREMSTPHDTASALDPNVTLGMQGPLLHSKTSPTHHDIAMGNTGEDAFDSLSTDYIVKTIGPTGWNVIETEQDWYQVLREKAFAVWADGVCNVLVELSNVPAEESVPLQRS